MKRLLVVLGLVLPVALVTALPAFAVSNNEMVIGCPGLSRSNANVDPIVAPGQVSAHMHSFFGNRTVTETSTAETLRGAATNCKTPGQTSAYWVPTPVNSSYFRLGVYYSNRFFPNKVAIVPPNAELVIGPNSPAGDGRYSVFYTCSAKRDVVTGAEKSATPMQCPTDRLTVVIRFPNCWDGVAMGPGDDGVPDNAHFAYSSGGSQAEPWKIATGSGTACPLSHPIMLVQTNAHFRLRNPYGVAITEFSSGPAATMHGDFVQSWVTEGFQAFVDKCLNVPQSERAAAGCPGVF